MDNQLEKLSGDRIDVNEEDVLRLLNYTNKSKEIADRALENVIIPFHRFEEASFDEYFWSMEKKEKYGNSYQLYIHSLRVCAELMNTFEQTGKIEYFDKAEEIVYSWINYISQEPLGEMVWYDHPTANRTQVLLQFLYLNNQLQRPIDYSRFKALLMKHGEILSDGKIYRQNNHGIMMDQSLLVLGSVLKDDHLFDVGYNRVKETFWMSFSRKGIHLENTPDYHKMVVKLYVNIENYLNTKGKTLGKHIVKSIKSSKDYLKYLMKPDGTLPSIGDAGFIRPKHDKLYKNFWDDEAGIALLQYPSPKSVYLTFVCGYSSRVHKHKDDLSITLNYNGRDFLVDPGKFNYSKSDIRSYIISRQAHSSFFMEQFDYSIHDGNKYERKIEITGYHDNNIYTMIEGVNGDYEGSSAKLSRNLILFKNFPLIIILDSVDTNVKHKLKFVQNFNLDSDVEIERIDEGYKLYNTEESIVIRQFDEISTSDVIEGNKSRPVALNATGFGEVETTRQLKFRNAANKGLVYSTAIYDDKEIDDIQFHFENDSACIRINDEDFYIYI